MNNVFAKIKKRFNDYLERMAEENKKTFGNQRLDCCTLNKTLNPQASTKSSAHH